MLKSLTELLEMARQHADLTGDGAGEMASGVTTAEAHVAAWHAIAVQGGFSSPQMEAWRLSADKGLTSRSLLSDRSMLDSLIRDNGGETPVDTELVGRCIGTAQVAAALADALARLEPAPLNYPEGVQPMGPNDRGEYTGADGKVYHHGGTPDYVVEHEGTWLDCDGCNPAVVVEAEPAVLGTPDDTLAALRALYDELKAAKDKATEEFDTVKGKLQTALSEASGGALRSRLEVPGFKPMTLTYTEPWTLDTKRLKAEQPAVYVEFAKQGKRWTLAESRAKS